MIRSEIFSKWTYLMKTFGLIGLIQMECNGSEARMRRICGSARPFAAEFILL